jgi:hypothetical protein
LNFRLALAPPRRNTEYSSSSSRPARGPTIRSVPDTDCENDSRTSVRTRSSVSTRKVDSATDSTISATTKRRFQALRSASDSIALMPSAPARRD